MQRDANVKAAAPYIGLYSDLNPARFPGAYRVRILNQFAEG